MKNKNYMVLYLISIGIVIINIIQTGLVLSIGFIELNPLGYNWFRFLLVFLFYLFMSIPFFIKDKDYKRAFLIGIIFIMFVGFGVFIHDFIIINGFI